MLGLFIKQERLRQNMSQGQLSQDICAASYLSKVESGNTFCSEEIYQQLLKKLQIEYVTDLDLQEKLCKEFHDVLEILRTEGCCRFEDKKNPISSLCDKMRYSAVCVKSLLLYHLKQFFSDCQEFLDLDIDGSLLPYLDDEERYLFFYGRALYFREIGDINKGIFMLKTIENSKEPWVAHSIGFCYYKLGENLQAIEKYQLAYGGYSEIGAVLGMLDASLCLLIVYCNLDDRSGIEKWSKVAKEINKIAHDTGVSCCILFNLGTMSLENGSFEEGIAYLWECEKIARETKNTFFQDICQLELANTYAVMGKKEKATEILKTVKEKELLGYWKTFLKMTVFLVETEEYLGNPDYSVLLESCFLEAKELNLKGMMRFYRRNLIQAYKEQRQYKKATAFLEKQ